MYQRQQKEQTIIQGNQPMTFSGSITESTMNQGRYITNENRSLYLVMQKDGNLCLFDNNEFSQALWASQSAGRGQAPYYLKLAWGNLAIYDKTHKIIWETQTEQVGQGGNKLQYHTLQLLENEQRIAILSQKGEPIWKSDYPTKLGSNQFAPPQQQQPQQQQPQQQQGKFNQPPGYQQGPPPGYQQGPPVGFNQGPPSGFQQGPPGGFQQGPPGGFQQGPPGGFQKGPPGGFQQGPPIGFQQQQQQFNQPPSGFGQGMPPQNPLGGFGQNPEEFFGGKQGTQQQQQQGGQNQFGQPPNMNPFGF